MTTTPAPVPVPVPVAAPQRLRDDEAAAVRDAIGRVLRDGPWILGDPVSAFEGEWAAYTGHPDVVGVGNGTDALVIAMTALGLSPGAGVLVAAVEGGYAATAARIAGLVPHVVDVDRATMGPTPELAAAALVPGVEAIVVTHLHGDAVPLPALDLWRREHGLALVEDCAQAHGLRPGGRHVGTTGDAATYSFYPTKNLGAVGDGGAVAFADVGHTEAARRLRQYGWGERFRVEDAGGRNTRLDTLQAAVLSARLPYLDERNARRRAIAARYGELHPVARRPGRHRGAPRGGGAGRPQSGARAAGRGRCRHRGALPLPGAGDAGPRRQVRRDPLRCRPSRPDPLAALLPRDDE